MLLGGNAADFWIEGRFFRRDAPNFGVEACFSGRNRPFFGNEAPFLPKRIPAREIASDLPTGIH